MLPIFFSFDDVLLISVFAILGGLLEQKLEQFASALLFIKFQLWCVGLMFRGVLWISKAAVVTILFMLLWFWVRSCSSSCSHRPHLSSLTHSSLVGRRVASVFGAWWERYTRCLCHKVLLYSPPNSEKMAFRSYVQMNNKWWTASWRVSTFPPKLAKNFHLHPLRHWCLQLWPWWEPHNSKKATKSIKHFLQQKASLVNLHQSPHQSSPCPRQIQIHKVIR